MNTARTLKLNKAPKRDVRKMNPMMVRKAIDVIRKEHDQQIGIRDPFVNIYPNVGWKLGMRGDNPNVVSDSRS
jgi:hypothetical protein